MRATLSGLQTLVTADHQTFRPNGSVAAKPVVGAWHKLEVRWDPPRGIVVARMRASDNTLLGEIQAKIEASPAGVSFASTQAEVDSLIGSAESR